tara:strand:- start:3 stop:374 length:372 start_codon:yes stop_codon:yes gene_type:complete
LSDILLVTFGAALGANLRFLIYKKLDTLNINKSTIILLINTFSSFLLGVFSPLLKEISNLKFSYQLGLFLLIGFLGSLSTFSSLISDLFQLFIKLKFYKALKLYFISVTLGVFALAVGLLLGG